MMVCSMSFQDCFTLAAGLHLQRVTGQNVTHWSVCVMHPFLRLIHRGNESLSYYPERAGLSTHTMIACMFNSRGP